MIGLGGTGADALLSVMETFRQRFELEKDPAGQLPDAPERTAYLAFDTDELGLEYKKRGASVLHRKQIVPLDISDISDRSAETPVPSYISEWLDPQLVDLFPERLGGVRQAGRLALFCHVDDIVTRLVSVIRRLVAMPIGEGVGSLEIVLLTGITGSTGSGMFLDMAYLIRHVVATLFPGMYPNFMAYILTPSVSVNRVGPMPASLRKRMESNGFAAMKELDFWMNAEEHKYPFAQKYREGLNVPWNRKPFDEVVFLGNQPSSHANILNDYDACMETISEALLAFYTAEEPNAVS